MGVDASATARYGFSNGNNMNTTNDNIPDLKSRKADDLDFLADAIKGLQKGYSGLIYCSTVDRGFIEPLIAQAEELLEQVKFLRKEEANMLRIWTEEAAQ